MFPSQPALEIPFADEDSDSGLTPVVPTFTGLASQSVPHELLEALERYKLVARLGHGGMAEVFLAAWEVAPFVHRPVVIKRLHEHFTEDPALVQMFLDEARLLCLLEHPHIVKTLEAGVIEGRCCIAMEYLEGQPLHRVLRRAYQRGKLPLELAVGIAIAMLDALDYAHDAKDASGQALEIVHRDVSPHNVFVTNDGQVKVLDFGIAKAKTQEGRTATGIVKGKVGYIAPEQAAAESVDRRADVWSSGVVLWEALTGSRLFKAETDAATLNQTLKGEIPTAAARRADLPVELDVILARALQRIPALRYRSAAAMRKDLEQWLASTGRGRDPQALAALMRDLFESEVIEQRRLVSVLMARSDCTPPSPSSNRTPSSTSALVLTSPTPTAVDATPAHERRRVWVYRAFYAALALAAGLAVGVACFVVSRLGPGRGSTPGPAAALPMAVTGSLPMRLSMAGVSSATSVRPSAPEPQSPPGLASSGGRHAASSARPTARPAPASNVRTVATTSRALEAAAPADENMLPSTAPAPTFGFLTIDTSPWSLVSIGGRVLGQTPLVGVKLPSGTQVLSLRNPELGIATNYTVLIEPGKTSARRIGIE